MLASGAWLPLIKSAVLMQSLQMLLLRLKRGASYVTARLMCIWCDGSALSAGA